MLTRSFRFLFTTSCPVRLEIPEIVSLLYIAKKTSVRVAIELSNKSELHLEITKSAHLLDYKLSLSILLRRPVPLHPRPPAYDFAT